MVGKHRRRGEASDHTTWQDLGEKRGQAVRRRVGSDTHAQGRHTRRLIGSRAAKIIETNDDNLPDRPGWEWTAMRRTMDEPATDLVIETDQIEVIVPTRGYVSGVKGGSFLDRKTGARDLGFGLSIVDFLLEPAVPGEPVPEGQYEYGPALPAHGAIAKRYAEGPQICTQAKRLGFTVHNGADSTAVRLSYTWHHAYDPHTQAGSRWEQTLVFPFGERYFLAADRVRTVQESPELFLRIDMPGHIRHQQGRGFEHVYLSYNEPTILPSTEFHQDFPPDARFLYRRGESQAPERFIRAYQVQLGDGSQGPWLAGMTLNPADVYQAWCHQRGYVCLIEEIGGWPTRPGSIFGACYLVGWFDDVAGMERAYDRFRGWSGIQIEGNTDEPRGYKGLKQGELGAAGS